MKSISKKLKSASGASMLLALLFLFFALTVGAVVLTAASVSTGRAVRDREDRQADLAVESAARLLQEDLAGMVMTGAYVQTDITVTTVTELPGAEGEEPTYDVSTSFDTKYAPGSASLDGSELLSGKGSDFGAVYYGTVTVLSGYPVPAGLNYSLTFQAEGMPDVEASLTVTPASVEGQAVYTITAVLGVDGAHAMTLVFHPQISPGQATVGAPTTSVEAAGSTTTETTTRKTTYTTTVTWTQCVVTKGAPS